HLVAFACSCSRQGIPLAACFREASEFYIDALVRSGVVLIDLDREPSVYSLFAELDRARAEGRYVVLMIDGSLAWRRRYEFLGYSVTASSLASVYSRRAGVALLPLIGSVISENTLAYWAANVVPKVERDVTQH